VIVYVESNFVLEIAAMQEQHDACEEILKLGERGTIRLVLPAFSVAEPYDVVQRRSSERKHLQDQLSKQLAQLSRTATLAERLRNAADIAALLAESSREERSRLDDALIRVLGVAEVIPVGAVTLRAAIRAQAERELAAQDSIIYASVMEHLGSSPPGARCFLNRNAKDFLTPAIQEDLKRFECRLISSFRDGLAFIGATLDA
jgi:predicted nucleic acid-binding protein